MSEEQTANSPVNLDQYKGKDVKYVTEQLKKQGYTVKQYDAYDLIKAISFPAIQDPKTVNIYVSSSDNKVEQIETRQ